MSEMENEVFRCGGEAGGQDGNPGCGEEIVFDAETLMYVEAGDIGEFWIEAQGTSAVMHAQCGLDRDLPLA